MTCSQWRKSATLRCKHHVNYSIGKMVFAQDTQHFSKLKKYPVRVQTYLKKAALKVHYKKTFCCPWKTSRILIFFQLCDAKMIDYHWLSEISWYHSFHTQACYWQFKRLNILTNPSADRDPAVTNVIYHFWKLPATRAIAQAFSMYEHNG